MKQRVIFHVDVNSAFLSWSAAENLNMGGFLDYRKVNCAIAKDVAGKSIILAKSDGAKALGVKTGEPIWMARQKCPDLLIVPPDFSLYLQASAAMKELFLSYTPQVEPFSIDECFLDMTGQEKFFGNPLDAAYLLKEHIKKELGFTVNVGIGENKPLAKMASELKKPDMIHTLWQKEIPEKLWIKPIDFLFMAGRQTVKKFRKVGIDTVGKLAHAERSFIADYLGKNGEKLWFYANGIDKEPVLAGTLPPPKSVSQSITLPFLLKTVEDAEAIFLYISEYLAAKLRKQKVVASVIAVGVKDEHRQYQSKQYKTPQPFLHRRAIFYYAMDLLKDIWPKNGAKYVGISLGDFSDEETLFHTLFQEGIAKEDRLDKVFFQIKERYGESSIGTARLLSQKQVKSYFKDIDEDVQEYTPRFF